MFYRALLHRQGMAEIPPLVVLVDVRRSMELVAQATFRVVVELVEQEPTLQIAQAVMGQMEN